MTSSAVPPDGLRPLPARPNLEFEKKRAKKLVKERDGTIKLAEAQFVIAREYGFASWRKLVGYYETWQKHDRAGADGTPRAQIDLERSVRELLDEFRSRHSFDTQPLDAMGTGAALSAYVPRFYGLTDAKIFSSTLSETEAQLVVARRSRFPDWKTTCEYSASRPEVLPPQLISPALVAAQQALGTGGTVRPDASDSEVVWEAFMMAALNGRTNTMKALLHRGFPIKYTPVWYNALHVSVSYRLVSVVEFLLANGADPDFRAWRDQPSPRDLSKTQQQHLATDTSAQQVHALILGTGKK